MRFLTLSERLAPVDQVNIFFVLIDPFPLSPSDDVPGKTWVKRLAVFSDEILAFRGTSEDLEYVMLRSSA